MSTQVLMTILVVMSAEEFLSAWDRICACKCSDIGECCDIYERPEICEHPGIHERLEAYEYSHVFERLGISEFQKFVSTRLVLMRTQVLLNIKVLMSNQVELG